MSELYSLRCPLCDQIALHFKSLAGEMFVASNIISSLSLRPNREVVCQDCRRVLPPFMKGLPTFFAIAMCGRRGKAAENAHWTGPESPLVSSWLKLRNSHTLQVPGEEVQGSSPGKFSRSLLVVAEGVVHKAMVGIGVNVELVGLAQTVQLLIKCLHILGGGIGVDSPKVKHHWAIQLVA